MLFTQHIHILNDTIRHLWNVCRIHSRELLYVCVYMLHKYVHARILHRPCTSLNDVPCWHSDFITSYSESWTHHLPVLVPHIFSVILYQWYYIFVYTYTYMCVCTRINEGTTPLNKRYLSFKSTKSYRGCLSFFVHAGSWHAASSPVRYFASVLEWSLLCFTIEGDLARYASMQPLQHIRKQCNVCMCLRVCSSVCIEDEYEY